MTEAYMKQFVDRNITVAVDAKSQQTPMISGLVVEITDGVVKFWRDEANGPSAYVRLPVDKILFVIEPSKIKPGGLAA